LASKHFGIKLTRHSKIRSLVKALDSFSPPGLAKTYSGIGEFFFDGVFQSVTHELTDRIAMAGKPTSHYRWAISPELKSLTLKD